MNLEQLANEADSLGATVLGDSPTDTQDAPPPPISNAQAMAGAIGAAREAFCFFTKMESPRRVLDDATTAQLGAVWGPVFDKHGWNLGDMIGDYALEFAAVVATLGIVGQLRKAVTLELAQNAAKQAPKETAEPVPEHGY